MKVIMVDSLVGNDYSTCLCNSLHGLGAEVHLVVPVNREFDGSENFIINYLSPSKKKDKNQFIKFLEFIQYIYRLYRYIRKNRPAIVHYQFFRRSGGVILFKFLKLININLVHTAHNVLPHENSKKDYFIKSLVYKNSNAIIVHSEFIKNKLLSAFPIERDKVKVVPHGNFDIYLPETDADKNKSRASLNLSPEDNVILFFGFIREYKGLDILLDAFELSASNDSKLKLLIAGSIQKKLEGFYLDKIDSSKHKDRIIFHSRYIPKDDIAIYFSASDAIMLPYREIDHSGIIHLAYSFGKPVIATNVGDFSEVIQNNESGILLNGKSSQELSEKINQAFEKKDNLISMGKNAKLLSDTKYSWDQVAKETLKVYKEIS